MESGRKGQRWGRRKRGNYMYMYIMSLFYRWARSQYDSSYTIRAAHCFTQHWMQERWWHLESYFERYKIYSILVFPFNPSSSSSSLSKPLTCAFCWEECPDSGYIGCCTAAPQSKTTPNTHTHHITTHIMPLLSLPPSLLFLSNSLFPRWFRVGLCPRLVTWLWQFFPNLSTNRWCRIYNVNIVSTHSTTHVLLLVVY